MFITQISQMPPSSILYSAKIPNVQQETTTEDPKERITGHCSGRDLTTHIVPFRHCYSTNPSYNCQYNSTVETCTMDHTTTLHLQPIGQETCLVMRDLKEKPAGTIHLLLHDAAYQRQQKAHYFTRNHSFHTESVHQCWGTRSRTGDTCKGTSIWSNIPEISQNPNHRPGFSYCASSCIFGATGVLGAKKRDPLSELCRTRLLYNIPRIQFSDVAVHSVWNYINRVA